MSAPLETPVSHVRALLDRCADGDRDAWDEFSSRFHRRIALFVLRATSAAGESDVATGDATRDLVQEVYVRLLADDRKALRAWRGESEASLLAYLARVARSVAVDAARRAGSRKRAGAMVALDGEEGDDTPALADRLAAPEATSPDHLLAERSTPGRIRDLLRASSDGPNADRDALVFQFYSFEGLTAREIAALPHLSLTVANVEVIVHRTRARLRRALEAERGGADF